MHRVSGEWMSGLSVKLLYIYFSQLMRKVSREGRERERCSHGGAKGESVGKALFFFLGGVFTCVSMRDKVRRENCVRQPTPKITRVSSCHLMC